MGLLIAGVSTPAIAEVSTSTTRLELQRISISTEALYDTGLEWRAQTIENDQLAPQTFNKASPANSEMPNTSTARHLYLPTGLKLNPTPTPLELIALTALIIVLSIFTILHLTKRLSTRPIGHLGHPHTPTQSEKKPATLAQEELGPGRKVSSCPTSPRNNVYYPNPDLPVAAKNKQNPSSIPSALSPTMPPTPSPPSVLRPTARPPTPHTGPSATIALAQGHYTGVVLPASPSRGSGLPQAVEAWRGIPYAQDTGGANRFRPPVPLAAVKAGDVVEVKRADAFGQICPGSIARVAGIGEGEDCLNLNVYRPVDWERQLQSQSARNESESSSGGGGGKKLMPVLVYVHGGAFNGGMGVERDMASFVGWAREAPILGINFNYRVGALGFPSSTAADDEGCLNLGLRDQRMLFEWVRENVGAFGGDRGRITVMGLSAGAHSVSWLLLCGLVSSRGGWVRRSLWDMASKWCWAFGPARLKLARLRVLDKATRLPNPIHANPPNSHNLIIRMLTPSQIGYHLQSPSSLRDPPFHAAILESGGSTARATLAANHPRTAVQWREFLLAASIDPGAGPSAIFAKLRELPLEKVLAASNVVFSRYQDPVRWPFQVSFYILYTSLSLPRYRSNFCAIYG